MVFGPRFLERFGGQPEQSPIRSIAILPLENLTGDPERQYFVDGLHEELVATFAQISAFDKVIARTSVMGFRDSDIPIREIGKMLGVEAVLVGSVRRSGNTVRATLQVFDSRTRPPLREGGVDPVQLAPSSGDREWVQHNIDLDFATSLLPEFIVYWKDSNQTHTSWNSKFLQHVKYHWAKRHQMQQQTDNSHGGQQGTHSTGRTRDRSLEQDLTDTSWAK